MSRPAPPAARVTLRVLGRPVTAEVPVPDGPVRLDAVLPLLRDLDDQAVALAAAQAVSDRGEPVSCRDGCSACCRAQPVPVTPAEALALARLVDALPEPRQQQVRDRFAANARRLADAGLRDLFLAPTRDGTPDDARRVARAYFALGLVCPFLDADSCGIYPDRPFVCRQYLVTSPAGWCTDPFDNPVRPTPTPVRFAHAALDAAGRFLGRPQYTVPLALALEYVERYRDELERRFPAEDVFREAVAALGRASG